MGKYLEFQFKSEQKLNQLLEKLQRKISGEKRELDTGTGYEIKNKERTFELQVLQPDKAINAFLVTVRAQNNKVADIVKGILGKPTSERTIAPSILEVIEFLRSLPKETTEKEVKRLLKEELEIEAKYEFYKKKILKRAARPNAQEIFKEAAQRLK
ncbi:MAG: hypothetical protein GF308_20245 [Candidatus Heimdallarchaeota archaeon]|nr:hypothetical protein [Candidatus Heimdallarchaeota archaeon]